VQVTAIANTQAEAIKIARDKTPPKEIKKAEEIRKQYFNNKAKNK